MNDSKHPMAAYRAQLGANQNGALSAISNQASPEQDIYSPTHGPRSLASSNSTTPLLPNGQLPSPGTLGYPGVIETKNFNNSVGTVRPPSTGPIQRIQRDKLEMLPPSGSVLPVSRRSTSNATTPQSGALTPLPIVLDSPQAPTTKRKREGNEALQKKVWLSSFFYIGD